MTDLIERLKAALDEDERIALGAAALCGCHGQATEWSFADDDDGGRITIKRDPHSPIRRQLTRKWNRSYEDMRMAHHIARHDPARTLAMIAAHRKILDWATNAHHCTYDHLLPPADPDDVVDLLAEAYGIEP